MPFYICSECGYLSTRPRLRCPRCVSEFRPEYPRLKEVSPEIAARFEEFAKGYTEDRIKQMIYELKELDKEYVMLKRVGLEEKFPANIDDLRTALSTLQALLEHKIRRRRR